MWFSSKSSLVSLLALNNILFASVVQNKLTYAKQKASRVRWGNIVITNIIIWLITILITALWNAWFEWPFATLKARIYFKRWRLWEKSSFLNIWQLYWSIQWHRKSTSDINGLCVHLWKQREWWRICICIALYLYFSCFRICTTCFDNPPERVLSYVKHFKM